MTQVFDQLIRAKLLRKPSADTVLSVFQNGVNVNSHRWRSLQYHHHHRHSTTTVSLWVSGLAEDALHEATFICSPGSMSHALSGLLHGGVGAVANYRDGALASSWFFCDESGRDLPFREYFVQTSHNTYILGKQLMLSPLAVPIVHAHSMTIALNLGYRCIELDIWRVNSNPSQVVRHGASSKLSNDVALVTMLEALESWMLSDEACNPDFLRVPLVLSVENNNSTEKGEQEMAAVFSSVLGARLILPTDFADPTLRELSGVRRGVVIKSSSYQGAKLGASEWAKLVALWKPPTHPLPAFKDATVCKSVEAPGPEFFALQSVTRSGKLLRRLSGSKSSTRATASPDPSGRSQSSGREEAPSPGVPSERFSSENKQVCDPSPPSRERSSSVRSDASPSREASKVSKLFALETSIESTSQTQQRYLEAYRAELKKRVGTALVKVRENRGSRLGEAEAANVVCKVYPSKLHERSENYDPVGAFDMGAQLISLNMQGKSISARSLLSFHAMRGGGHVPARDRVKRDRVRSVEHMFVKFGALAAGSHHGSLNSCPSR